MAERAAAMTAEIEREIDHTRRELALTLAALERKLAARYLVEKGFDMFKDTLGDDYGLKRGLDIVRDNPVPIALIGIGAAWLLASNSGVVDRIAQDQRITAARRRVTGLASDVGNRAGELASTVAERVGIAGNGADRPLGYTGNPMVDEADTRTTSTGWVHQMSDMAQDAIRSARDSGGAVLDRTQDQASRIADQVTDAFERHPLLIGAIGVMAGAMIAALLPATRVEDEWFGGARDELWQRAEAVGQEAVSRVRDTAVRAADAAADAAADTVKSEADKSLHG
jgi:Protein of unknown function (DUF3618)